jgi:hypothetical protein
MSVPAPITRGVRPLRRLLRENDFDLRGVDLDGFRRWLAHHLARWRNDPVFAQRVRVRDLGRAHPGLRTLEQDYRRAARAEAASPQSPRLRELEKQLADTGKALAGLTAASQRAAPERRLALQQKLRAFQDRQQRLLDEQANLVQSSPTRQHLLRVHAELQQLRSSIGLDREEVCLEKLLTQQGRRSGRSGESFEQGALAATETVIVPDLLRGGESAESPRRLRVLRGVTFGAARTEFDQLVVRLPRRDGRPVEVLAVVEAKRNINDLAHGFLRRQENLAWLTGDADAYDPALYRTQRFRSGHFDREAVHHQQGETFPFARTSFRRFRRDPASGLFLDRLFFITRPGTLWGVSAAALGRLGFRVATDERWDPDSDVYLGKLLHWCLSLAGPTEAPDVLRLYAAGPRRGRQVLLVGGEFAGEGGHR